MTDVIAIVISVFALIISILAFAVQYINQRERRHGEITQLRSEILMRLSLVQQRAKSSHLHLETARIEIRKIPDSNYKYEFIENLPAVLTAYTKVEDAIKETIRTTELIDTKEQNKSEMLITLQDAQHKVNVAEEKIGSYEEIILKWMKMIREKQSSGNEEPNE